MPTLRIDSVLYDFMFHLGLRNCISRGRAQTGCQGRHFVWEKCERPTSCHTFGSASRRRPRRLRDEPCSPGIRRERIQGRTAGMLAHAPPDIQLVRRPESVREVLVSLSSRRDAGLLFSASCANGCCFVDTAGWARLFARACICGRRGTGGW
jgi:hypothetical protein